LFNTAGLTRPAFQKKEVALMTRILLVLSVAAVMAAMLVASAMPAFAAPSCEGLKAYNGQHRAHSNADDRGDVEQGVKHYDKEVACYAEEPPGEGQ
jgi:hypothetical protein